mgnify:CR=1 FL=1
MRALLVEDDDQLSERLSGRLRSAGFAVDVARSRSEGEDWPDMDKIAVIILDLGLPDGSGMELLDYWRRRKVTCPILILTARGSWQDKVAGLNAGLASDTWPLMQGRLVPEFDSSHGALWAVTHDPFLLHFLHRWWAWIALVALIVLARRVKPVDRKASVAIQAVVGTQIILGIITVLTGVALWVAVAHQVVGALLVASFAWGVHALGRRT